MTREFTIELPKEVFEKLDHYNYSYKKTFEQLCKNIFLELLDCEIELRDE